MTFSCIGCGGGMTGGLHSSTAAVRQAETAKSERNSHNGCTNELEGMSRNSARIYALRGSRPDQVP